MRRLSNGAGQTGSNVLGAMAQITASSRAARGVYSSVAAIDGPLPTQTIIEYVDHRSGLFTVLFTLGLFIATTLLWISTRRASEEQIAHLRASSERQLRAYVYLENAHFNRGSVGWGIKYKFKNFGQTPAHSVRVSAIAQVVDWNGASTEIPTPRPVPIAMGSMAPMGDFFENDAELEGIATLEEIQSGVKAIYLVGAITYFDVFQEARSTRFRYYIGGDMGCEGDEMFAGDGGNEATLCGQDTIVSRSLRR